MQFGKRVRKGYIILILQNITFMVSWRALLYALEPFIADETINQQQMDSALLTSFQTAIAVQGQAGQLL